MHCDWFIQPPLLLLTPTIWFSLDYEQNISDRVVNRVRGKWKHSDSSDSDSIKIMTLLTTLTFDFHQVISALTTPLTTPTLSLVNSSLNNVYLSFFKTSQGVLGGLITRLKKRFHYMLHQGLSQAAPLCLSRTAIEIVP